MRTICAISILLLFASCDFNKVYEFNYDFPSDNWKQNQLLNFDFEVIDTSSYYNLFINIRNTPQYKYSNLYLFLTIAAPNAKHSTDTVECVLANNKGKWLGESKINLLDNRILYKKNIRFPIPGIYRVKYEQAMREESIANIKNMGFRLEKTAYQE